MDRLDEIAADFALVPAEERLYLLLDFAERLPPLPARLEAARDAGLGRVHECQSPVFLYAEADDGRVALYADVPREAPTVRGLVGLLVEALDGAPADTVAAVPDDLLYRLGIAQQLGMRRQQGFAGVLHRLKASAAEATARAGS
ncbi:MAG: SufE family protein [Rubricoccaceae bacterium]|nr:SufE family protein [Rubricoccaceae bacterium]